MSRPLFPSLYQINTRVWLTELSMGAGGRPIEERVLPMEDGFFQGAFADVVVEWGAGDTH